MSTAITSFTGKHSFLSNFSHSPVTYEGAEYASVEHAYQAAKTLNLVARRAFQITGTLTAGQAKRLGKTLDLRTGWEEIKVGIMYSLLVEKFSDTNLRLRLLATEDAELVEGNDWGDTFWGVCDGVGENYLGQCLMKVRDKLRKE
jgi:hypothetical protein